MASVPGYVYAQRDDAIWVNLYVANNAEIKLDNGRTVKMTQETRYPWDGAVKMTVAPDRDSPLTIHVRIPGWEHDQVVAGDLYHYESKSTQRASLKVNGQTIQQPLVKGYIELKRTWKKGDTIELNLPMPVRRVRANIEVAADQGRFAIERGPIVYAAEWVDNPGRRVRNLAVPESAPLTAEFRQNLLKGVEVVKGRAVAYTKDEQGGLVKKEQEFTAIPYYAWANRGSGEMTVWLPDGDAGVTPAPFPSLTNTAMITANGSKSPLPVQDGEDPRASNDTRFYFDWTAASGSDPVPNGWLEYRWDKPVTVSQSSVYWFDNSRGAVRLPASWKISYLDGNQWKPAQGSVWGTERDKFNHVTFQPVTTTAVRLEVNFQSTFSAGVQRWQVK
jgi:hypothetical protein